MASLSLMAGCGGSGSDSTDNTYSVEADTTVTTASIAQSGYASRVNQICRKAWGTILENFVEYSSWQERNVPQKKRFEEAVQLSLMAGIIFHIFDNIQRLGAPRGMEQEVEGLIGSLQAASEQGQKKLEPIGSVAQIDELFSEYNQLAHRRGLDECLVDEARLQPIEQ